MFTRMFSRSKSGLSGGYTFRTQPLTLFLAFLFLIIGILLVLCFTTVEFVNTDSQYLTVGMLGFVLAILFLYIMYINFNVLERDD